MTKTIISMVIAAILLISSCNNKNAEKKNDDALSAIKEKTNIPFTEVKNYFVKNTYKGEELVYRKFTSQAEFDSLFGMAKTMSEESKPTAIDFSTQYVIAVIGPSTNIATTLSAADLSKSAGMITLTYKETTAEKQSFTMRPLLLIVVDNQYQGTIMLETIRSV